MQEPNNGQAVRTIASASSVTNSVDMAPQDATSKLIVAPSGVPATPHVAGAKTAGPKSKPSPVKIVGDGPRSKRIWTLGSIVGGLLIWETAARLLNTSSLFLPPPTKVVVAIVKLSEDRLPHDIGLSGIEFIIGYVLASAAGILIGLVMATSVRGKIILEPWMSGLYATPTIALAPLFILLMGIGIWSKVAVVFILVVFPVVLNTEAGLRTTSKQLIETIRSFGATRSQIFWKVSLPSALPFIFAGLKIGIGRGLIGVVVAELFGSRAGLGQLITQSAETFNMPELFAAVIILAIAGITMTSAFGRLERRIVHWH
jgi:NitT/TauT family transport system permease protein